MICNKQKQKLMASWGDKAEAMDCFAEVRIFDPLSPWECYIFAQNPENHDEVKVILVGFDVEVCDMSLEEIFSKFNSDGEYVEIDALFRPIRADKLLKRLKERKR